MIIIFKDRNKAGGFKIDLVFSSPFRSIVTDLATPSINMKNFSKSFGFLIKKLFFGYVFFLIIVLTSIKDSSDVYSNLFRVYLIYLIK
mgnify:CR=1 FL=1|tara:strand:+ start:920 stop:1183 length:264 start_codon:yes stop_codon:yes gene_type:complete